MPTGECVVVCLSKLANLVMVVLKKLSSSVSPTLQRPTCSTNVPRQITFISCIFGSMPWMNILDILRDLCKGCGQGLTSKPLWSFLQRTCWLRHQQLNLRPRCTRGPISVLPIAAMKWFARDSISSTYIYNSVLCKNNGQNAFLVVTLHLEGDCARTYVERPQRVPTDVRNGVTEVLCLPNTNQKKAAQTEAFTSDFMHL